MEQSLLRFVSGTRSLPQLCNVWFGTNTYRSQNMIRRIIDVHAPHMSPNPTSPHAWAASEMCASVRGDHSRSASLLRGIGCGWHDALTPIQRSVLALVLHRAATPRTAEPTIAAMLALRAHEECSHCEECEFAARVCVETCKMYETHTEGWMRAPSVQISVCYRGEIDIKGPRLRQRPQPQRGRRRTRTRTRTRTRSS